MNVKDRAAQWPSPRSTVLLNAAKLVPTMCPMISNPFNNIFSKVEDAISGNYVSAGNKDGGLVSRRDDLYHLADVRATSFGRFAGGSTVAGVPNKYQFHRATNSTLAFVCSLSNALPEPPPLPEPLQSVSSPHDDLYLPADIRSTSSRRIRGATTTAGISTKYLCRRTTTATSFHRPCQAHH
ncbi:hypothetical protein FRC04_008447 [Tulasnella sp. 424]|nr:hypothetical protein FRC04_008447 [Tulasnella sp. 424]